MPAVCFDYFGQGLCLVRRRLLVRAFPKRDPKGQEKPLPRQLVQDAGMCTSPATHTHNINVTSAPAIYRLSFLISHAESHGRSGSAALVTRECRNAYVLA